MRVLLIGGGGREHAIASKIIESPRVEKLFAIPGNPGIAQIGECVTDISSDDFEGMVKFAKENKIDITVVGPEVPLVAGISDLFLKNDLQIFGPTKDGAKLEGSKVFSKEIMEKYDVPTAKYAEFIDKDNAINYLAAQNYPLVIKADGLAAGKGVVIAEDERQAKAAIEQMMAEKIFGAAGDKIIIEEFLLGEEASILAFTDGETIVPMASAQDHKRIFDGDKGPNTGGMGAYSPAPVITDDLMRTIKRDVLDKMLWGLNQEGIIYKGVLYAGIMVTKDGPKVLEFNVRFGDPETQCILPRLETYLIDIFEAVIEQNLKNQEIKWKDQDCVTVVMAAKGYPGVYEKGMQIKGLTEVENSMVFQAGTKEKDGDIYVNGGRVLAVTALGNGLQEAINKAYHGIFKIFFQGAQYRKDIGQKGLNR